MSGLPSKEIRYAFVMGWPQQTAVVKPLAVNSTRQPGKILNVEMLGHASRLKWTQDDVGLHVDMPPKRPCDHAITLKVSLA
jgi:alpha-L-fucosidase